MMPMPAQGPMQDLMLPEGQPLPNGAVGMILAKSGEQFAIMPMDMLLPLGSPAVGRQTTPAAAGPGGGGLGIGTR